MRDLGLSPIGSLGGTVTTPTGPLAGATVRLWDHTWKLHGAVQTDAAGTYRFEAVPQGAHVVTIDVPAGYIADESEAPVQVAQGLSKVDFRLRASGRLAGRVVDTARGSPLANVDVEVVDATGKALARAKTSKTGDYEFAGLLASEYQVRVRDKL